MIFSYTYCIIMRFQNASLLQSLVLHLQRRSYFRSSASLRISQWSYSLLDHFSIIDRICFYGLKIFTQISLQVQFPLQLRLCTLGIHPVVTIEIWYLKARTIYLGWRYSIYPINIHWYRNPMDVLSNYHLLKSHTTSVYENRYQALHSCELKFRIWLSTRNPRIMLPIWNLNTSKCENLDPPLIISHAM